MGASKMECRTRGVISVRQQNEIAVSQKFSLNVLQLSVVSSLGLIVSPRVEVVFYS